MAGKLTTEAALAADIEALNENVTLRLVCVFRADYGHYPRRFNPRVISGPSSSPSSVPIFR